nr:immunoglobulin heavy chain junction region [Macaca mulatta]
CAREGPGRWELQASDYW